MIAKFILKVKRAENKFYRGLYRTGKFMKTFSIPSVKFIHLPLFYLNSIALGFLSQLKTKLWDVPLFRARCEVIGPRVYLPNGLPLILGAHLKLLIGDNVTISRSTIGASKVLDEPVLEIGDNSSIGYGTTISVAEKITIGRDCLISIHCLIMDSDDHPLDPDKRRHNFPVDRGDIKPIKIGDNVWIGAYSAVLKGVAIGNNTVVAAHAVVTHSLPSNCICAGSPAKVIRRLSS